MIPPRSTQAICRTDEDGLNNRGRLRHQQLDLTERLHGLRRELADADTVVTAAHQALSTAIADAERQLAADRLAGAAVGRNTATALKNLPPDTLWLPRAPPLRY